MRLFVQNLNASTLKQSSAAVAALLCAQMVLGNEIDSAAVSGLLSSQQAQAKAVTNYATTQPTTLPIKEFFDSPEFVNEVERQETQARTTAHNANEGWISKFKKLLPSVNEAKGQLKYGKHVVVSPNGPEIIELIRKLATAPQKDRYALLAQLSDYAANNTPEALNFLGFIWETGSFGAKKDIAKATQYYQAAADSGYQPAIYNLALVSAYGKNGRINYAASLDLLSQASQFGAEASSRVCGMASFISFRSQQREASLEFAKNCGSPLAHLANATYNPNGEDLPKRVALLRITLATGIDDAYSLIARITQPQASIDNAFTFCKYALIERYRSSTDLANLHQDAIHCVERLPNYKALPPPARDQVIAGLVSFVPVEINQLRSMRDSNRFHYDWPVPFLPFTSQEVVLFEPLIPKAKS